jgi:hypothetical protein
VVTKLLIVWGFVMVAVLFGLRFALTLALIGVLVALVKGEQKKEKEPYDSN